MRYQNPAHETEEVISHEARELDQDLEHTQDLESVPDLEDVHDAAQTSWLDHNGTVLQTPPDIHLPTLTRPVSAMHIGNLEDNGKDKSGQSKSGYPDKILVWGATPDSGRLLIEAKTFWSLRDEVMYSLVSSCTAKPKTGEFTWKLTLDTEETKVLKQVGDRGSILNLFSFLSRFGANVTFSILISVSLPMVAPSGSSSELRRTNFASLM